MIGVEVEFSDPYDRDVSGNAVIDRDFEQNLEVLREGAQSPLKPLIEISQIVFVSQILHRPLSALAACSGHYHDHFSFGNPGFDDDERIIFYQLSGLCIIFGDVFPLISRKKVLIADGCGGTGGEAFPYRSVANPLLNPIAAQQDGVMILEVFGDQLAALLEREIFTHLVEKPCEPIESDGLAQTSVLVIGEHKLWRRQVIDDKSLTAERIAHDIGLLEGQIDAHFGQRSRVGRMPKPVD